MNDPPPPYSFTPSPTQPHQQPSIVVANSLPRDSNVPPPLPPRTQSFATSGSSSSAHSQQISVSSPGGTYSYSTGISYLPPAPHLDTYSRPHPADYAIPTSHDAAPQAWFADNQQVESECYLYPGSYSDPIDSRDLQEKAEKQSAPQLPPRPPAAIATRGEHFAQPVAARRMASPLSRLDPVMGEGIGTEGAVMGTVYRSGEISQTHDQRTQSTQSIVTMPPPSQFLPQSTNQQQQYHSQQFLAASFGPKKRRLLLIYIHGFLGSATSFNEFPKHLHTLLTCLLSTSCPQYTVHTKIYPRFKTRHPIGEAAEMFSQWLSEFEDEDEVPGRKALRHAGQELPLEETDVILLGHSMGGLLAGEVVLLPRLHPAGNDPRRYRHRILGLVGFDTPFLGMHPGVVTSGISSLFRPSPKPDKRKETTPMSPTTYEEEDLVIRKKPEHFDTGLPSRSDSGNRGIRNFLTKYSANIPGATVQYVMSHMEFAACLADPMGLSTRYRRLRGLEDGKDLLAAGGNGGIGGYRVRFVNYYTVCYGRDKEKEKEKEREEMAVAFAKLNTKTSQSKEVNDQQLMSSISSSQHKRGLSTASVNTVGTVTSVATNATADEKNLDINGVSPPSTPGEGTPRSSTSTPPPLPPPHIIPVVPRTQGDQKPSLSQSPLQPEAPQDPLSILNARSQRYSLPEIPPPPVTPPLHEDLSHITDPKLQKVHMKENKRLWKEHWRRQKVHSKLIKDREKVLFKLERKVAESPKPISNKEDGSWEGEKAEKLKQKEKKERKERRERRERKFCLIPKEAKGGDRVGEEVGGDGEARDETWVKVPMGDVDEVGAHCGLFMAGAEIFETQRVMKSQEMRAVGDNSGGLVGVDTGNGRQSMDGPQALVMDDDERRELETKRRQYERLVGDLAERIEGWVKEHVGGLQAMEVAGQALKEGKNRSADQKC